MREIALCMLNGTLEPRGGGSPFKDHIAGTRAHPRHIHSVVDIHAIQHERVKMSCPKYIDDMIRSLERTEEKRLSDVRPDKQCNHCGKAGVNKKCSACGLAYYCHQECQKADRKEHKVICNRVCDNVASSCTNVCSPDKKMRKFALLHAQWQVLKAMPGFMKSLSTAWDQTKERRDHERPFLFLALNLCSKGRTPTDNPDVPEVDMTKLIVGIIERDHLIKKSGNDSRLHTVIKNVSEEDPNMFMHIVVANTNTPTEDFPMYVTKEEIYAPQA